MLGDGVRDGRLFALRERDIAADDALQLGELANRLRHEIGLGEMRGALCLIRVRPDQRRKLAREALDALHPLKLCPELFVERHLPQKFRQLFQRPAQIVLPEKLRVREPRADHALVARDDGLAAVLRLADSRRE